MQFESTSCDNSNVKITGAKTYLFTVEPGEQVRYTEDDGVVGTFFISANQRAPGETVINCEFTAKVGDVQQSVITETDSSTSDVDIRVAYLGLISTNLPSGTIKQTGPQQELRYDLEISNLGNSLSKVDFRVDSEGLPENWKGKVPAPNQITIESSAQGGEATTKTVPFIVTTPFKNGWNNDETTILLTATPQSTKDLTESGQGQAVDISVLSRVRGVYVPGFEPIAMIGAILGIGLLARRIGRQD